MGIINGAMKSPMENVETESSSRALACLRLVLEHWAQEDSARMTSLGDPTILGLARQPRKVIETDSSVDWELPESPHACTLRSGVGLPREGREHPLSRLEPEER